MVKSRISRSTHRAAGGHRHQDDQLVATRNNGGIANPGDVIGYERRDSKRGRYDLTDVQFTDTLDSNTTLVPIRSRSLRWHWMTTYSVVPDTVDYRSMRPADYWPTTLISMARRREQTQT